MGVVMRLVGRPLVVPEKKKKPHQTSRRRIFLVLRYGLHHKPTCPHHPERQRGQRGVDTERMG